MQGGNKNLESFYRPLFIETWKSVVKNKSLWVFGGFAALAMNVSVLEVAWRVFKPTHIPNSLIGTFISNMMPAYDSMRQYCISTLQSYGFLSAQTISIAVLIIAVIIFSVASQIWLIKGGVPKNDKFEGFARAFTIDAIIKIVLGSFTLISLTPVALWLVAGTSAVSMSAAAIVLMLLFAVLLSFCGMAVYWLISVIKEKHSLANGFNEAWRITISHPIITFETAVLVLFVQILSIIFITVAALLLSVPYVTAFNFAINSGSTDFALVISFAALFVAFIIVFLIFGFQTALQYTIWTTIYERLRPKSKVKSKLHRIAKTMRIV